MDKFPTVPTTLPVASEFPAARLDHPASRFLLQQQQTPHLGELTLGLLHKFNNLFTGVMFLTEDCLNSEEATEGVRQRLTEISGALRQAHTFVDRVVHLHLDESEESAGYHELDAVIDEQLDLLRLLLPRGTNLEHRRSEERLSFYASRRFLSETLLRVVGNSGEALPSRKGTVTITSRAGEGGALEGMALVEVHDSGPGFSPEVLEHLFEPFQTTKAPATHTGLSLYRSREAARQFSGDLLAGNHPDGGAVVTIILPRENTTPEE